MEQIRSNSLTGKAKIATGGTCFDLSEVVAIGRIFEIEGFHFIVHIKGGSKLSLRYDDINHANHFHLEVTKLFLNQ